MVSINTVSRLQPATRYCHGLVSTSSRLQSRRTFSSTHALFDAASSRPLKFHIGLSYASKNSPPFISREEAALLSESGAATGFNLPSTDEELAKRNSRWLKIARWKENQLSLGGGRAELFDSSRSSSQSKISTQAGQEAGEDEGERIREAPEVEEDKQRKLQKKSDEERKKWGAGEDFFFVGEEGNSKRFLAVSDGVGGWTTSGVDPSLFSQALMYHSSQHIMKNPSAKVLSVLDKGYSGVLSEPDVLCGSATACVVSLDSSTGKLQAANLGDSGYLILRDGKIVYFSPSQTHYFNCPRQLTKLEKGANSDENVMDLPSHADITTQSIKPGDMVVLFTDGLSDNVHPSQIEALYKHIENTLSSPANSFLLPDEKKAEKAKLFADVLVGYARLVMTREDVETPFEVAARQEGMRYKGGKIDDVTVVTALVSELD